MKHFRRGRFGIAKEYIVHAVVLLIVGGVVLTNQLADTADRDSMLFRLLGEAEVEEGPLDTAALKERKAYPLQYNAMLAAAEIAGGGISEDDIEFELANTLGGNALISPNDPETSAVVERDEKRKGVFAYRIQAGDTPSTVAAKFGISTNTVLWANGIDDSEVIRVGDVLVILPTTGVLHTVQSGENLAAIAKKYDAKLEDILKQNSLSDPSSIKIGQKLIVPDGYIAKRRPVVAQPPVEDEPVIAPPDGGQKPAAPATGTKRYIWPTVGTRITQYFGWRHTGIDIANKSLPPVYAAAAGTVTYSGWLGAYGRLIIIDHGGGHRTYYAHLTQTYVAVGEKVAQGRVIGKMGSTGRSTGPHLHFEIRINGGVVNPLNYL